jgi:Cu2+-exporting ATPase
MSDKPTGSPHHHHDAHMAPTPEHREQTSGGHVHVHHTQDTHPTPSPAIADVPEVATDRDGGVLVSSMVASATQAVPGHTAHTAHADHSSPRAGSPSSEHKGHDAHAGHVDHTGHELMFRNRFWVCLLLTLPVLLYSHMLQMWFGFTVPAFPGSIWIGPLFAFIIFIYGGVPDGGARAAGA